MTSVKFLSGGGRLSGFILSGHSTENENDLEGKLVCSAVSSAAFMAANTVIEILGEDCKTEVSDGFLELSLKNPSEKSVAVLEGLKLHLTELKKQYDKRIEIITEV